MAAVSLGEIVSTDDETRALVDSELRALIRAVLVSFDQAEVPKAARIPILEGALAELRLADAIVDSALTQIHDGCEGV